MRWVKLHTTLHHNIAFRRLSAGARLVFYVALEIAGDLEQDGALAVRGAGPLSVAEIANEVGIKADNAQTGLDALVNIGFMRLATDGPLKGAYIIEKWAEKTGVEPSTARVKRFRERKRNVSGNADTERSGNGAEVEEEVDITTPNGVGAPPFQVDPTETPERLADAYSTAFVNCKLPKAIANRRARTVGLLREFHGEGYTWQQIFTAAHQAYHDGREAPLFGAGAVWSLLRGLGKRGAGKPHDTRDIGGDDATAAIKAKVLRIS